MFVVLILAPNVHADTILAVPTGYQLLSSDSGTAVKLSAPAGAFGQQSNALSDALSNVIIDSVGVGGSSPGPQSPFEFDVPMEATGVNFGKVNWEYKAQDAPSTVMKIQGWTLKNIGSTVQAPVEMLSLSLRSVSPLQVTYGNGASSSFFDVFVELLPSTDRQNKRHRFGPRIQCRGGNVMAGRRCGLSNSFLVWATGIVVRAQIGRISGIDSAPESNIAEETLCQGGAAGSV